MQAKARQLFAEHLDRHTHNELTAFVWKIMYDHTISSVVPKRV